MTQTEKNRTFDLEDRTLRFARRSVQLARKLQKEAVNRPIVGQLIRSSCSIGANYREANDALSKKDFLYRIKICRKEARETSYWLNVFEEGNDGLINDIKSLYMESLELRSIFSSIANKSR